MKAFPISFRRIQDWAEEDRPREKLRAKGAAALTDVELLAILIGSGTVSESAVDVAKNILRTAGNDLRELGKLGLRDLMKIKGIGEVKAVCLMAALELGRRRKEHSGPKKPQITSSRQAYEEMKPYLLDKRHEEFWILLLNRANYVLSPPVQISLGGVAGTVVDAKVVFKHAIDQLASAIVLVHNHPSGRLTASAADKELTRKLVNAGHIMNIPVVDHLIFTDEGYMSFADERLL